MTKKEERLLVYLVDKATLSLPKDWKDTLRVHPMNDGKMGSLYLIPNNLTKDYKERHFGRQVSDCHFYDNDGVDVIASLYVDDNDYLLELDIWKVNFQPLIEIPNDFHDIET
ncbi:MAG: hypothetical protein LBN24_13220 [Mediterranea sp.]|nr:hypothetical protein [Mediterranea sp.]